MNFGQNLRNKVFYRMFGSVVMELMTLSGHLSNVNEINFMCIDKLANETSFMDSPLI